MNKKIPALRGKGFIDEWKESKMKDMIKKMYSGASIRPNDYTEIGVPTVPKGAINPNGLANLRDSKYVSEDFYNSNIRSSAYPHDLVTSLRDLVPSAPTIGRMVKVNGYADKYLMPQGVYRLILDSKTDENFLISFSNTTDFRKRIFQIKNGSTQVHIRSSEYLEIDTLIPNKAEQSKIGFFFKHLNELIELHQHALDLLKQRKKAFLQKMFPKKGENIPEIRFSNFIEEWEVFKAREIFKSVSDKNHADLPVLSASQEKGMVFRNDIGIDIQYNKKSTHNYKRVLPRQFVIHLRSFQGGFAYSNIEGITSPAYTIIDFKEKNEHVSEFWRIVFNSRSFIKSLETVTYGIRDGRSISFTDFSSLNFSVPTLQEQEKIGNFFKELDNSITLQEEKLESLKLMKKAFLQKMFV